MNSNSFLVSAVCCALCVPSAFAQGRKPITKRQTHVESNRNSTPNLFMGNIQIKPDYYPKSPEIVFVNRMWLRIRAENQPEAERRFNEILKNFAASEGMEFRAIPKPSVQDAVKGIATVQALSYIGGHPTIVYKDAATLEEARSMIRIKGDRSKEAITGTLSNVFVTFFPGGDGAVSPEYKDGFIEIPLTMLVTLVGRFENAISASSDAMLYGNAFADTSKLRSEIAARLKWFIIAKGDKTLVSPAKAMEALINESKQIEATAPVCPNETTFAKAFMDPDAYGYCKLLFKSDTRDYSQDITKSSQWLFSVGKSREFNIRFADGRLRETTANFTCNGPVISEREQQVRRTGKAVKELTLSATVWLSAINNIYGNIGKMSDWWLSEDGAKVISRFPAEDAKSMTAYWTKLNPMIKSLNSLVMKTKVDVTHAFATEIEEDLRISQIKTLE